MHAPLPPDSMTLAYHELRAPLGLMATAAASVAEASPDATARAQCEVIMRAAERLLRTTARVLALAQPAPAGTEACAYTPAPLVERIVADFGDLDVQLDFATSVVAARALVWGHEADFETLVSSLLMNAIDHGDPNEPISIFVEDDGTTVSVCIRNQAATRAAPPRFRPGHAALRGARPADGCDAAEAVSMSVSSAPRSRCHTRSRAERDTRIPGPWPIRGDRRPGR